jgi:hypothetical protein
MSDQHLDIFRNQAIEDIQIFISESNKMIETQKLMLELQLSLISDLKSNLKRLNDLLPAKQNGKN